jgi:hypothetical protein
VFYCIVQEITIRSSLYMFSTMFLKTVFDLKVVESVDVEPADMKG